MQRLTITTTLSAQLHHLPPLISTPIFYGAPEIEPQRLNYAILSLSPFFHLAFANVTPHHDHHLICVISLSPSTDIHPHF